MVRENDKVVRKGEDMPENARTDLVDAVRLELGGRGIGRAIVLGDAQDPAYQVLARDLARWGIMVLTPPPALREQLDLLVAEGCLSEEGRASFQAVLRDGVEHGVGAIVTCGALLADYVEALGLGVLVLDADALSRGFAPVRTVVFDMGGVLLKWDPLVYARAACDDEEDAQLLSEAVFGSQEWAWQDAGAVGEDTVAWTSKARVPKRLHAAVDQLVYHWHDARAFMPQTGELVRELKAAGFGVYLLSNAGESFVKYCEQIPAFDCFDGVVVSYAEHVVKPDARIYRALLDRYGLDASTCLFVDDVEKNVEGARRVGMRGWRFDGDVARLRRALLGR